MSMREYIRGNRTAIDSTIRQSGYTGTINDDDRAGMIMNVEGLYLAWLEAERQPAPARVARRRKFRYCLIRGHYVPDTRRAAEYGRIS
jgi:hypothetical protein